MIEDGRLNNGWQDAMAIKDLQKDVCAEVVRSVQPCPLSFCHAETSRPQAHTQHQVCVPDVCMATSNTPVSVSLPADLPVSGTSPLTSVHSQFLCYGV